MKNVYSLVLSEELVSRLDRVAYQNGTSRSGMLNRILAEYFSVYTPEARVRDTFESLNSFLNLIPELRITAGDSTKTLCARSAIQYKYNPTINYNVIINRAHEIFEGEIRILARTQNAAFLRALYDFFSLWCSLEPQREFQINSGRLTRIFSVRDGDAGREIGKYIKIFDSAIKAFFAGEFVVSDYAKQLREVSL